MMKGIAIFIALVLTSGTDMAAGGNVIFIHPDGAGIQAWGAARMLEKGPDGQLAWDELTEVGIYNGHMKDSLVASSNGGATTHAYGVKVNADSFGNNSGKKIQALSGFDGSIMQEAIEKSFKVGVINSGHICEPGTACFLSSADQRSNTDSIAAQVIESRADVILSGGEKFLLPEGTEGKFGSGARKDGRNLIEEAGKLGYTVIYTRDELKSVDPSKIKKLLGVFAHSHTFNDWTEEMLTAAGKELYEPEAPALGEMTEAALRILTHDPQKNFFLVVEEEGSDNFGNKNNASGMMEALKRADGAFRISLDFLAKNPETLLITAADSDAGGIQVVSPAISSGKAFKEGEGLHGRMNNAAPLDGNGGFMKPPFVSAPDQAGKTFTFGLAWSSYVDVAGGIAVKASGYHAEALPVLTDNTGIYRMIYLALFGKNLFDQDTE